MVTDFHILGTHLVMQRVQSLLSELVLRDQGFSLPEASIIILEDLFNIKLLLLESYPAMNYQSSAISPCLGPGSLLWPL